MLYFHADRTRLCLYSLLYADLTQLKIHFSLADYDYCINLSTIVHTTIRLLINISDSRLRHS